ncbi:MAG: TlpA disulfide reductase family protein [Syntrophobacteraceae bacterium]
MGLKQAPERCDELIDPRGILVGTAIALIFILSCPGDSACQTGLKVGTKFPEVSLQDLRGNQVTLPGSAEGKIFIAHFWAIWCPYCVGEVAILQDIEASNSEKGIICYSINAGDSAEAAKAYIEKAKATYTVLLDPNFSTSRKIGVKSIPTTFICDRKGVIRYKILGEVTRKGLDKLLSNIP